MWGYKGRFWQQGGDEGGRRGLKWGKRETGLVMVGDKEGGWRGIGGKGNWRNGLSPPTVMPLGNRHDMGHLVQSV